MTITAIFTESRPDRWPEYHTVSGKRVEITEYRAFSGGYTFKYEDFVGFATSDELTEPSIPLSLLEAKRRILGT